MGIFDRIILAIYMFVLIFLSLGIMGAAARLVSLEQMGTSFSYIYGNWEAGVAGALFLLISIRLLLAGIRSRKMKDTVVTVTEMGQIRVSIQAMKQLIEKVVGRIRGVRTVHPQVVLRKHGLGIVIKVVVGMETVVPVVAQEIQEQVRDYLAEKVGISVADVEVFVDSITNDFVSKPRPRVE